jgi:hypothetical protein
MSTDPKRKEQHPEYLVAQDELERFRKWLEQQDLSKLDEQTKDKRYWQNIALIGEMSNITEEELSRVYAGSRCQSRMSTPLFPSHGKS